MSTDETPAGFLLRPPAACEVGRVSTLRPEETERRAHPRYNASVQIRVAFTGQSFSAESINLSAGGLLLDTQRRLPLGTRVQMHLELPLLTKYPIRVEAEVVRTAGRDSPGLALRFIAIDDEDRALLAEVAQREGAFG